MKEKLNHRLALPKDLEEVHAMYMDEQANPYLTFDPMPLALFEKVYGEMLAAGNLYVVEKAGEIIGTYRLLPKTHRQAHILYLGGFAVCAPAQGKGYGRQILLHIQQQAVASGFIRLELTVDLDNPAVHLYRKVGFEVEGVIRKSYKNALTGKYYDEYLMGWIGS